MKRQRTRRATVPTGSIFSFFRLKEALMRGLSLAAGSIARKSAPAPPLLARGILRFHSRRDSSHEASTRGRRPRSFRVDSAQSAPAPSLLARGIPRFHSRRNPSHEKCAPSPARIYQIVHEDSRRHGGVEGLRPAAHGQLQAILFLAAGSIARGSAPSGHFASAAKSFP